MPNVIGVETVDQTIVAGEIFPPQTSPASIFSSSLASSGIAPRRAFEAGFETVSHRCLTIVDAGFGQIIHREGNR